MRLYDVADFLLLPGLQLEIKAQFDSYNVEKSRSIQYNSVTKNFENIDDFILDVRAAYSKDAPSGDAFRGLMNSFIYGARYRFFGCPVFIDLLSEIPQLGSNLLKEIIEKKQFR